MSADTRSRYAPLILLFLAGVALTTFKLGYVGLTYNSDYVSYLGTSAFLSGAPGAQIYPGRLLKPLEPLTTAAEEVVLSSAHAFVVQFVLFYFLLLWVSYALARAFGLSRGESALYGLLIGGSYPVLKYGLDLYTETGALFFYIGSLALTLLYLRAPERRILYANIALITLGTLWKEYSIVAAVAFGFALLFHPQLSWRTRFTIIAIYAGIFLAVNLAWQLYVYRAYDYSYFSFYKEGTEGYTEFGVKDIAKSITAVLGLAWLLLPVGLTRWRELTGWQQRFLLITIPVSCMAFLWGFAVSRLYFVIAPAFLLIAFLGLGRISSPWLRYVIIAATLAANLAWLVLSYRVTL